VIIWPFKKYDQVISEWDLIWNITAYSDNPREVWWIHTYFITAGKNKDFGSPYRQMSKEEKDNIQKDINTVYDEFVNVVASWRNIKVDNIKKDMWALSFIDTRAQSKKLIDWIMDSNMLFEKVQKDTKLKLQAITVKVKSDYISSLFESISNFDNRQSNTIKQQICNTNKKVMVMYGDMANVCN